MSANKTSSKKRVRKHVKVWAHGEVVPAGKTVYKAVKGNKGTWFILKCTTTAGGVATDHGAGVQKTKFKVPSVLVNSAEIVLGGTCKTCWHRGPKIIDWTSIRKFHSDYDASFKYEVGKVAVETDYSNSLFCGQGIHVFPNKRAAIQYAD